MEDLTGVQLGPYRVVAPLGEGGMATVYRAYQPSVDRYVALKILPRHFARDPEFVGRFQQEAKVLAKLLHPHILPVHDYGESDGYTYIAMPFVETGTLADLLQGGPMPMAQIERIISQVGGALDYAHSQGVVHRDVKPSNVLIDSSGNCLLTDFGIAKMVEGTAQFTRTGGIVGTPAYMSPEQIRGEALDGRSDIYSLGVVLYEMATGRPPYRAETPPAIFVKHLHDPLPLPRSLNPALPEAVERVILKALAKDPAGRYATAADMVMALGAAISAEAPEADRQTVDGTVVLDKRSTEMMGEPSLLDRLRSMPGWILAGGGVIIAGVVFAIVLAALSSRPTQAPATSQESVNATQVGVEPAGTQVAGEGILGAAEAGATGTARAMATAQIEASATATAREALIANAVVVFQEDFSSNAQGWWVGESSDGVGDYLDQMVDGRFRLSAVSKQPTWNWTWVPDFSARDLWLRVDATIVEASGDAVVGISFREDKNGYYYVEFAGDGSYRVRSRNDEGWSTIQPWTPSDAIRLEPGMTNTFAILVEGPNITLYANERELTTVQDTAIPEAGIVSLVAELPQAGQRITVDFDNLVIKEVPIGKSVAEIQSTATARAQARATARAAPTVTAIARATALAGATVTFQEDFTTNENGWWVGEGSDDYGDYESRVVDGVYRFSMTSKQPAWNWNWVPNYSAKDFWLRVQVTLVEASADANVSITFRENKNSDFYRVQFANDGTYRVRLFQGGEWRTLQEWMSSDAIRLEPGVANIFAVLVEGSDFTLYANDQELATVQDSALSEAGKISLAIGLDEGNQTVTVDFDNLVIKEW